MVRLDVGYNTVITELYSENPSICQGVLVDSTDGNPIIKSIANVRISNILPSLTNW
jgi:hypothetical protein